MCEVSLWVQMSGKCLDFEGKKYKGIYNTLAIKNNSNFVSHLTQN